MDNKLVNGIIDNAGVTFEKQLAVLASAKTQEQVTDALQALNKAIDSEYTSTIKNQSNVLSALMENPFSPKAKRDKDSGIVTYPLSDRVSIPFLSILSGEAKKEYEKFLIQCFSAINQSLDNDDSISGKSINSLFSNAIEFSGKYLDSLTIRKNPLRFAIDAVKQWKKLGSKDVSVKAMDISIVQAFVVSFADMDVTVSKKRDKEKGRRSNA